MKNEGAVTGVRMTGMGRGDLLFCVGLSVGLSLPQAVSGDYQGISTPYHPRGH